MNEVSENIQALTHFEFTQLTIDYYRADARWWSGVVLNLPTTSRTAITFCCCTAMNLLLTMTKSVFTDIPARTATSDYKSGIIERKWQHLHRRYIKGWQSKMSYLTKVLSWYIHLVLQRQCWGVGGVQNPEKIRTCFFDGRVFESIIYRATSTLPTVVYLQKQSVA